VQGYHKSCRVVAFVDRWWRMQSALAPSERPKPEATCQEGVKAFAQVSEVVTSLCD
jgi:hypothetical protein